MIILLSGFVCAQVPDLRPLPGSHYLNRMSVGHYLDSLKASGSAAYRKLATRDAEVKRVNALRQQERTFWALTIDPDGQVDDSDFYTLEATLRKSGASVRIWVENSSWAANYVTQAEVEILFNVLTVASAAGSIDPGSGIIDIERNIFGDPPNKAGDGLLHFLILDIRDGYDPDAGQNGFIAGYFFANDQTDRMTSNQMDLMYIDARPGIYRGNNNRHTATVLSTAAHELQHLIHYTYDVDESIWMNEGLSELAAKLCGYSLGNLNAYLMAPQASLTGWNQQLADYARVGLWSFYLYEQFGIDFIRRLIRTPQSDIAGINAALSAVGASRNFEAVFNDWLVANLVSDVNIDSRYGYRDPGLSSLEPRIAAYFLQYPQSFSAELPAYSGQYFLLAGADTLEINFTSGPPGGWLIRKGADGVQVIPVSSDPFIYPEFNNDDEFTFVFPNTAAQAVVSFCAYAPQSASQSPHRPAAAFKLQSSAGNRCSDDLIAAESSLLSLFPNPTAGAISVKTQVSEAGVMCYRIFNVLGQQVAEFSRNFSAASKSTTVRLADLTVPGGGRLSNGIYFLRGYYRFSDGRQTHTNTQKFMFIR